ncbi:hypothetical protein ACHQM5_004036 [Ranunculus cassubicifolius]
MTTSSSTTDPISSQSSQLATESIPSSSTSLPQTLSHINIHHYVPIKLKKDNFVIWQTLFNTVFKSTDTLPIIDGTSLCPPPTIASTFSTGQITTQPNPSYKDWIHRDQTVLLWLQARISDEYLPYVVGFPSSRDLWISLDKRFAALSRSHILHLKNRLQTMRKGSSSIDNYLQQIKEIADNLAASGSPIPDSDLVYHILNGLPTDYNSFSTSIRIREPPVSADELHSLLLSEELIIETQTKLSISDSQQAFIANFSTNRGRGNNRGRGRGRHNYHYYNSKPPDSSSSHIHQQSPSSSYYSRPPSHHNHNLSFYPPSPSQPKNPCQICGKPNHSAADCYHRMNHAYQGRPPPSKLNAMSASNSAPLLPTPSSPWLFDSGASSHFTNDPNNLDESTPYSGPDNVNIANGEGLSISHTGSSTLHHSAHKFHLNNVHLVPQLTTNLISVHKFVNDNACSLLFSDHSFFVKDNASGQILF